MFDELILERNRKEKGNSQKSEEKVELFGKESQPTKAISFSFNSSLTHLKLSFSFKESFEEGDLNDWLFTGLPVFFSLTCFEVEVGNCIGLNDEGVRLIEGKLGMGLEKLKMVFEGKETEIKGKEELVEMTNCKTLSDDGVNLATKMLLRSSGIKEIHLKSK